MSIAPIASPKHNDNICESQKRKLDSRDDGDDHESRESKRTRVCKVTFADTVIVYEYEKAPVLPKDAITPLGMDEEVDKPFLKQIKRRCSGFADVYFSDRLSDKVVKLKVSGSILASKMARLKHTRYYDVLAIIAGKTVYCRSGASDEYGVFDFQTAIKANVGDDVELIIHRNIRGNQKLIATIKCHF